MRLKQWPRLYIDLTCWWDVKHKHVDTHIPQAFAHICISNMNGIYFKVSKYMYNKTCVKQLLKNRQNKLWNILMTTGSLMNVKSIAECSLWSILQYFWPALSDGWSWKPIFCLFESSCFTQILLYMINARDRDTAVSDWLIYIFCLQADVFSYGVICCEITGRVTAVSDWLIDISVCRLMCSPMVWYVVKLRVELLLSVIDWLIFLFAGWCVLLWCDMLWNYG